MPEYFIKELFVEIYKVLDGLQIQNIY